MDSFGNQENNVFSDPPWGGCDKWDSAGSKSFWHRAAVDPNSAKWNIRCDGVTWCCKHLTQRGSCTLCLLLLLLADQKAKSLHGVWLQLFITGDGGR